QIFHTGFFPSIRHPLEVHGLLQPILALPLFLIGGPDDALMRIPSVVCAGALAVMVYWGGKRLFGVVAGVVAAILIFTRSDVMFMGVLGLDDVGFALFAFGSMTCFAIGAHTAGGRAWFVMSGLFAALAALEKLSGLALPAVFTAVLAVRPYARRNVGWRNWLYLILPCVPVLALYVLRNYRVYGTPGSAYGPIEWLGKDQISAYFAYYPDPPTTSEVFAQLGHGRVLQLVLDELLQIWTENRTDFLYLLGIPALVLTRKRNPLFPLTVLFFTPALLILVCVVHHVEQRYLSAYIPLFAVAIGGVASQVFERLKERIPEARRALFRGVSAAAALALLVFFSRAPAFTALLASASMRREHECMDAANYLRKAVDAAAPVLTANPWFVSWETERPAVLAPTNGDTALLEVVARYKVDWAISGVATLGMLNVAAALDRPDVRAALEPEVVFDGAVCDVYRFKKPHRSAGP
ncbi:MAG TPA: glycosyltransferase family 39 protein, partial [Polyangiaceae bacterium]|nr:glycosyltransferase family 39 protein [Polyangiaceae bacterium]